VRVETVEYAPGRLADLFGHRGRPTVLVWHGKQANARAAVRPMAELLADKGCAVVVPDWNSHAEDGGRTDLLRSVQFAQERSEDRAGFVLVGWSLGGVAAAGLTIRASHLKVPLAHTVCLAGAFMAPDPISGEQLPAELPRGYRPPFTLLHGVSDDVVPVSASRDFASTLERNEWPVQFIELAADHASIAGAVYDPVADRYSAAEDPDTLAVAADVASRIAAAFGPGTG
jgi:dienelactone hydrolase